ncbi:MAG: AsmA family protein [Alphaproteobacteria bacterium]|nr:AsmA family protein [Alphaproteobacteria bacterium]
MKILYGVGALIVLIVIALFVAPILIDWDGLKPSIIERAEVRLGRKLAIDGPIEVSFLPIPKVSVSDVRLANLPGANVADMARAKRLDLDLAVGPLLGGDIVPVKIVLVDPVIELERLASGQANWQFEPRAAPAADSTPADPKAKPATPDSKMEEAAKSDAEGGGLGTSAIQALELRNGTVVYRDARSKHVEYLHDIDATLSAREEGGPYQARGVMTLRERPIEFEGVLGRTTRGAPTPLSLKITLDETAARLGFDGAFEAEAAKGAGTLSVEGKNFAMALERFNIALPDATPDLAKPFVLSGAISGDAKRFDAKELKIRVGETSATGAASYVSGKPDQLDLVLVLNSLDLDLLTGAEPAVKTDKAKTNNKSKAGVPEAEIAPAAGPKAAEEAGTGLPMDLNASINLTIEAVKYRASVIRAAEVLFLLEKGVVTVQQARAELPGGAAASLTGKFTMPKGQAAFDGALEIRTDDLRTLAAWLGIDLADVPADRLRRLALSTSFKASDANVVIPKLTAKFDNSTLNGSFALAKAAETGRPQITANFSLDRLALDAYRRAPDATPPEGTAAPEKGDGKKADRAEKESARAGSSGGSVLSDYDIAGTVRIDTLSYRDLKFTGIEVKPELRDGVLKIGALNIADVAGVALAARGEGRALESEAPQFSAAIEVNTASLAPLARALDLGEDIRFEALGRSELNLKISGTPEALVLDGQMSTKAGRLNFKGDVGSISTEPRIALDLDLANATEESIRALFGSRSARGAEAAKPVWLRGRLSGDQNALAFAAQSLAYGETELAGDIGVRFGGKRPFVSAALKSPHMAAPSGEGALAPDDAASSTGEAAGRGGSGKSGRADGGAEPTGAARWSREPFDLAVLSQVDGEFKIEAERLLLGKWMAEQFSVEATLKDAVLDITRLDGRLFDGALSGHGRVNGGEQPSYAINFALADADIDALLRATGKADAATGRVTVEGEFNATGNSEHAIVNSLGGDVAMHGRDGTIEGVDLGAVVGALGSLSDLGSLADAGGLVQGGLSKGRTQIKSIDGTVRFVKGVGRADDIRVVADAGLGAIVGEADLPRWRLDMTATFTVDQPPGTPPFGVRLVGPIDKPTRQFAIDPLMASIGDKFKERLLNDERLKLKLRKGAKAEPGTLTDKVLRDVLGDPDAPATGDDIPAPIEGAPPPEPLPSPDASAEPEFDTLPEAVPAPAPAPELAPAEKPELLDLLKQVIPELSKKN